MAEISDKPIIPLVQTGIDKDCLAMLQGREYISFDFNNPISSLSKLEKYLKKMANRKKSEQIQKIVAVLLLIIIIAYDYSQERK